MDEAEIAKRRAAWVQPKPRYTRGVLGKYFRLVGTASKGAVTDLRTIPPPPLAGEQSSGTDHEYFPHQATLDYPLGFDFHPAAPAPSSNPVRFTLLKWHREHGQQKH